MKRMLASAATAALALGGLVATAMPASAHTPNVDANCTSLSLDLKWYQEGGDGKTNTVTVTVNGETVHEEPFGDGYSTSVPLDPTRDNKWVVQVDAWDGDTGTEYDETRDGTTTACQEPEPEPEKLETAFYVYPKLRANEPAAWHNSGFQTLITTRDGEEFWETLPEEYPGDHFNIEDLPADACESWGVQQDVVRTQGDFAWSEFIHITYPDGPLFDWRLKADRHTDLSNFLPECSDEPTETPEEPEKPEEPELPETPEASEPPEAPEPVTLPAPSSVEDCEVGNSVDLPETAHATYTEKWNDDRTEVTVTATPAEGVQLADGAETEWTFTFTGEICASEPVVVTPELPTVVDLCGTESDDIRVPVDSDEVTYEKTSEGIVATAAEGFAFDELPAGYSAVDTTSALYTVSESTFTDEMCELVPGDIGAVCDAETPYLVYGVTLPEGAPAPGENPLTVTFINPGGGNDHVTTDLPLEGRLLWPGASAEEPLQWPGWERLEDGSYVETDGNFAWTRDGVQVRFEVNPDYSTVVEYPPASEECADAPADIREAAAQTVVDVPEDAPEVAAEEDELALTGATVGVAAAVALLLVAGGAALFIVRRRLHQG
ncbi:MULTISPECIES: hypothetical protein [Isoptericola]|nr:MULTISPECIES: hypothetical protein [Isoptericola]